MTTEKNKAPLELGTKPVGQLLTQYAIPAIIAMTAASLYNIIDSIFIGQGVGAMAISGLAITFPFHNLAAAFGAAVGVGASTCISVRLGQKDYAKTQHILGNTFTLNIIIGLSFSIICLLFLNDILFFFGASEQTLPYARDYMTVILLGNVFSHMYFGMNAVLRAIGKPRVAMYTTIATVILNIMLAPLFIYVFGWGISGAALATILSQIIGLAWLMILFTDRRELLHLKRGTFGLKRDIVGNIIAIGLSPFSMNVCACIIVIFINNGLQRYGGDMAVGAFGIINRITFVFIMVCMGLNQGMQPIVGYNYGAMKIDRLLKALKYTTIAGMIVTSAGFLLGEFAPEFCARLFTTDETLIDLSVHGLRITLVTFPIVGFHVVVANFFQSIGKAKISIFLSLSRQMIFLLPLLIVLPLFMDADGIWWSMPISDILAVTTAALILITSLKKLKQQRTAL